MGRFFLSIFLLSSSLTLLADQTVEYQKKLSKLKPNQRLYQLEKDLNPKRQISLQDLNDWEYTPRFNKCLQDEGQYLEIEDTLLKTLKMALKNIDFKEISSLFDDRSKNRWPKNNNFKKKTSVAGIDFYLLTTDTDNNSPISQSFLNNYSKVVSVDLDGVEYLIDESNRAKTNLNFRQASLHVIYDIRGFNKQNSRQNDRGHLKLNVVLKNGQWKINDVRFLTANRVVAKRKPAFRNLTANSGLSQIAMHERSEAIRRGGYALALTDINGDGNLDIFSGSAANSQLLLGTQKQTWVLSKNSGLDKYKSVKTAIFSDVDNDGDQDAIMTLFEYDRDDSDLALSKNSKGRFVSSRGFVKGKLKYNLPMPATVADFNLDGLLDLYVGFPGKRDFTILSSYKEDYAYPQGLFFNISGKSEKKTFIDATKAVWGKKGLSKYNQLFPHSSIAVDYDFDGDSDLLVVDDRSNLSPIYENKNGKEMTPVNESINLENKGYGMGVAIGDLNNDGINEIALTNVNFHARKRFHSSCSRNWYMEFDKDPGIRLFQGNKSAKNGQLRFNDITISSGLEEIGEGAAGVEFIDYNNDGLLDIYVATGLWSGSNAEKKFDLSSLFARAVAAKKTYNDVLAPYRTYRERDWSFISILRDSNFKTSRSMAGFQRNRLFLNLGNLNFLEVGFIEGVDSISDGYVIATGDPDKDGRIDLFLRNGDPGTMAYTFPTLEYFKNEYDASPNNSLRITLEGTKSNRDAIGSVVEVVTVDGAKLKKQIVANNGAAQSERLLHFGIGKYKRVKSVKIKWPSGLIETLGPLNHGLHHFKEGFSPQISSNKKGIKVSNINPHQ